ncbi:MAG: hypothetical protein ACPHCN_08385 [Mycobacterium sp.]
MRNVIAIGLLALCACGGRRVVLVPVATPPISVENATGMLILQSAVQINGGEPSVYTFGFGLQPGMHRNLIPAGVILPAAFDAVHVLSDGSMVETHDTVQAEDPVIVVR